MRIIDAMIPYGRETCIGKVEAMFDFEKLHRQVVFGKSCGKIIWQPRIGAWYHDKVFFGERLPPPFTDMDMPDIYRELGCSARIYDYNACFQKIEHPSVQITEQSLNETDIQTIIDTPVGRQLVVRRRSPNSRSLTYLKWEVSSEEELKVATWRKENTSWRWDQEAYEKTRKRWGILGAPTMYMPRVNIQDLYINTMGVEDAVYAVYDWTDTVNAYFKALDECHDRLIEVINASPIEIVNFGDNIHGGTLPPNLFCRYVLPVYRKRCDKLHQMGKFVHAHWDGDVKNLLPYAPETGLDGVEAITPKPQGDVSLEEIKLSLGRQMVLLDGLPAILFNQTYPVALLDDYTHRLIEMFAPRLVLGISDEISAFGDIERIRRVGKIVANYNAAKD